jgi:hypothetical protein
LFLARDHAVADRDGQREHVGDADAGGDSRLRRARPLKRYPIERYARDARAGALMRPWTQEIATQQAWEAALGIDPPR